METNNDNIYLSDQEIYDGLLNEDEYILSTLFNGEQFKTIIGIIKGSIFRFHDRDFDSLKSMVFNDLWELFKDKEVLHKYETEGGSILIWLARTAIRYYQNKRRYEKRVKLRHQELLAKIEVKNEAALIDGKDVIIDPENELEMKQIIETASSVIDQMENKKYAEIMRRMYLQNDSCSIIESSNISQDRKRALKAFLKLYSETYKDEI